MANIRLNTITGTPPFEVYVSDVNGNNQSLIGIVLNNVPPTVTLDVPSLFNNLPQIGLTIIDGNGCSLFYIIPCNTETDICFFGIDLEEVSS
jgi:hypothetical protein